MQDDAYVSFRYARNLVRGDGLVYNVGEPVEGYTNFLWTALAAVPLARGAADPLPFMHAGVGGAAGWARTRCCSGSASRWGWRASGRRRSALLPLAVHWSYNMWFFSGMETPLVSLLTIAAVGCVTLDPRAPPLVAVRRQPVRRRADDDPARRRRRVRGAGARRRAARRRAGSCASGAGGAALLAPALPLLLVFAALPGVARLVLRLVLSQHVLRQGRLSDLLRARLGLPARLRRSSTACAPFAAPCRWSGAVLARPGPARRFLVRGACSPRAAVVLLRRPPRRRLHGMALPDADLGRLLSRRRRRRRGDRRARSRRARRGAARGCRRAAGSAGAVAAARARRRHAARRPAAQTRRRARPGDHRAAAPLHRSRPLRLAQPPRELFDERAAAARRASPRPRPASSRTSAIGPASICTGSPTR